MNETQKVDTYREAISVAEKITVAALKATKLERPGILGVVIAAVTLARMSDWDRDDIERAFAAAMGDIYGKDDDDRPLTLNA
jgi:hypothetical protein